MSSIAKQAVHTGNTVYLMIGSDIIGRAQSATISYNYNTTYNYGIGSFQPQESVYMRGEYTVQLEKTLLKKEAMFKYAKFGDSILKMDVIDITLVDQVSKQVIASVRGCSQVSGEFQVRANDFISNSSTWQGLVMSDTTGSRR